jgi:hypothetical protein
MHELYSKRKQGYRTRADMALAMDWPIGRVNKAISDSHDLGIGPGGLKTLPFDLGHDGKIWYSTRDRTDVIDARQIHGHASSRGIHGSVDRAAEIKAGLGYEKKAIEESATRTKQFDEDVQETRPLQQIERKAAEREQRKLESPKQKKRNKRKHDKEKEGE